MQRPDIKTHANLEAALAGESMAHTKYRYFAAIARAEGNEEVAKVFEETAAQEVMHALGHLDLLYPKSEMTTERCLQMAIEGETYEYTEMYPPMLKQAEAENHKAKRMFGFAVKTEEVHARLYKLAMDAVSQGKDLSETNFYLCPVCGHIEMGKPPESCPICKARGSAYIQI